MKLLKKNVRLFNSFDEYETYYENHEHFDYVTDVLDDGKIVSADAEIGCKSWKTAIRRFFNAVGDIEAFDGWEECMTEAAENDCFELKSIAYLWNEETCRYEYKYTGDYAYTIEQIDDDCWYVSLRVRK